MNTTIWILVADSCRAKIYSAYKAKLFNANAEQLKLVSEHEHEECRKKDIDLVSDKQGQFGSGTFVPATDPKQHEEALFAFELSKVLTKGHAEHHFQELIFVAPPVFMGMLHKSLPHEIDKLVTVTIEKDYTKLTERDLMKHLQEYL